LRRSSPLSKAGSALALAAALCACSPGAPPLPPAPPGRATFDALFASRQLTGFALAPSGEAALYTVVGAGGNRLVERSLSSGAERQLPLAPGIWPWRLLSVSPRGRELLLVGGAPGDGCRAPLAVRRDDGRLVRVDAGEGGCASFLGWLREGEGLLLASDEGLPAAPPAAVEVSLASGLRSLRFTSEEPWRLGPLSRDGRRLVVFRPGSGSPPALAVVELASGELSELPLPSRGEEGARLVPQAASADGRELFALIEEGGRRSLARLELGSGRWRSIPSPCAAPERVLPSPGGRFLGVDCASGRHHLLAPSPEEGSGWRSVEVPLPTGAALREVSFRGDDGLALAAAGSESWPLDLFAWRPGEAQATQLTYHLGPRVDPADLGPSRSLDFPGGGAASLFLGRAGRPATGGVIWIEDPWPGTGHPAPAFHPLAHWLAGQGLAVLRVRASASPFGDPVAPPETELLARAFGSVAGGTGPSGIVAVGREAGWAALLARGRWRCTVALAPGAPPVAGAATAPGESPDLSRDLLGLVPPLSGQGLLLGLREGDTAFPGALRSALTAEGAAPGPGGAFGPESAADLELWRAAARLLREELPR